jgi:PTS system mannose-specific IIA component
LIGLVVVGHGDFPEALLRSAESVLSGVTQMRAVALHPEDDPSHISEEIEEAVKDVNKGDGVIIMTDMMGGTPTNAALAMLNQSDVEVVTGVNLPMLLKLPFIKGKTSHEAATFLVEYGRRNLAQPSEMLQEMKRRSKGDEKDKKE